MSAAAAMMQTAVLCLNVITAPAEQQQNAEIVSGDGDVRERPRREQLEQRVFDRAFRARLVGSAFRNHIDHLISPGMLSRINLNIFVHSVRYLHASENASERVC